MSVSSKTQASERWVRVNEESKDRSEDGEVEVLADEDGVVRKERGVEGELHACDVKATVLCKWVVAVEEKRESRQCH